MGRRKLEINVKDIKEKYYKHKASFEKIAKEYGCSEKTIRNRMMLDRDIVVKSPARNIRRKNNLYDYMESMLQGELRKIYWNFYKTNRFDNITYEKLIKMDGSERAKILRSNPKARKMYTEKTQRVGV